MNDASNKVSNTKGIPREIQKLQNRAAKSGDLVERMRLYSNLVSAANGMVLRIKRVTKEHEQKLKSVEAEIEFLARHKAKEDMAFRALRGTYGSPESALATFNELCQSYAPDYVKEVIQLGSYRLGTATGMNFLGMKMAGRTEAEHNFTVAVLPALNALVEDQKAYLELKATNLQAEHEEALKFTSNIADQRLALESAVREYERERKDAAVSMQTDDIRRLDGDEQNLRISLLPQKQRDAEIAAMKDH